MTNTDANSTPDQIAPAQLRPWAQIPRDYRHVMNGQRYVLAMTSHGTALVPWYGPGTLPADHGTAK